MSSTFTNDRSVKRVTRLWRPLYGVHVVGASAVYRGGLQDRPSLTVDTECLSCTYFLSQSGVSFRHSWLRRVNLLLLCCSVSGGDAEYLSVYACLCVTLLISQKPHILTSPNFVCKLPVSVAQPSSDGTATCYLLPVLWKMSFLHNVPYSSMTAAAATSL